MKPPLERSEIVNFDITGTKYEKTPLCAYPVAILKNDKSNALFGKNQYILYHLVEIAQRLIKQPLVMVDGYLTLFGVAVLNKEESKIYKRNQFKDEVESVLPLLKNKKYKEPLFKEISLSSQNLFKQAVKQSLCPTITTKKRTTKFVGELLGVAIVANYGIDEFQKLRKSTRNYIFKALQYILFEDRDIHNEILPELAQLKEKLNFDFGAFLYDFRHQAYEHYGIIRDGVVVYPKTIKAFERSVMEYNSTNSQSRLGIFEAAKDKGIDLSILETVEDQQLYFLDFVFSLSNKWIGNHQNIGQILSEAAKLIQDKKNTFDFFKLLTSLAPCGVLPFFVDEDRYTQIKKKGIFLEELILPLYLKVINSGKAYDIFASNFIAEFILSKHYTHTEANYKKLYGLVNNFDLPISFYPIIIEKFDLFQSQEKFLRIPDRDLRFYNRLIPLLLDDQGDILEGWNFVHQNKSLFWQKCLTLDNKTYQEAIIDCEDFKQYRSLLEDHNPLLLIIRNFNSQGCKTYSLSEQITTFSDDHTKVKAIHNARHLKEVVLDKQFKNFLNENKLLDVINGRVLVVPIERDKMHIAWIDIQYRNSSVPATYALKDISCEGEANPWVALKALQIVQNLNKSTL